MYGNKTVRLLYIVPVCLSANAAKQNRFELDMSLSWMTFTFAVWLAMLSNLSLLLSLTIIGTMCLWRGTAWGAGALLSVGMLRCVLQRLCCGRFMWPLAEAGLGSRYLVSPFAVRLGHPVHKSVVLSLPSSNIILLLYQMVHLNLLKWTSHPASVKTRFPN